VTCRPKAIPLELRDHLAELTGNELKVWMCYWSHTNDDGTSHPSNETIEKETGLCLRTIKPCKKSLRDKHWLAYTGDDRQPRNPSYQFAVPVMQVLVAGQPLPKIEVIEIDGEPWCKICPMEKPWGKNTVVQNLPPEGFCSGSDSDSDSSSSSDAASTATTRAFAPAKGRKSKPFNPTPVEPRPKPKTKATATPANGGGKPVVEAKTLSGKEPYCIDCGRSGHWRESCPANIKAAADKALRRQHAAKKLRLTAVWRSLRNPDCKRCSGQHTYDDCICSPEAQAALEAAWRVGEPKKPVPAPVPQGVPDTTPDSSESALPCNKTGCLEPRFAAFKFCKKHLSHREPVNV
jgi:Helix-turn-helix domain